MDGVKFESDDIKSYYTKNYSKDTPSFLQPMILLSIFDDIDTIKVINFTIVSIAIG